MRESRGLQAAYAAALEHHGYAADPSQLAAVATLDGLARRLAARSTAGPLPRLLERLRGASTRPGERGAYLWGGVGRGKTFLMDLFHGTLDVPARREHFHRFMKDVHGRLHALRDTRDPLVRVGADLAGAHRVLCLDELFVTDIADAMLLGGLFAALIDRGVTLVCTSNVPPSGLYRDGLQRQRFLPAIALLEKHTEVISVDGGYDYRLRQLERAPLYLESNAIGADERFRRRFAELAGDDAAGPGELEVEGRRIPFLAATEEAIWFEFGAICDGPRSAADYVEIARDYHTVAVSGVPRLDGTRENEARRFITLVDELYDRGVKLLVSAEAPPAGLYAGERLRFEFERTKSRLAEMQTTGYLARPHRA